MHKGVDFKTSSLLCGLRGLVMRVCARAEGPVIIFMEPHCVVSRQARIRAKILEDVLQYLKDLKAEAGILMLKPLEATITLFTYKW